MNKERRNNFIEKAVEFVSRKETHSAAMILMFVLASLFTMFVNPQVYRSGIHEGDVALKDIYAPYDFTYSWGVNEEKTQEEQRKALEKAPYLFLRDRETERAAIKKMNEFFDAVKKEKESADPAGEKVSRIKDVTGDMFSDREIRSILDYHDVDVLRGAATGILGEIFSRGYTEKNEKERLRAKDRDIAAVLDKDSGKETLFSLEDLIDSGSLAAAVESRVAGLASLDRRARPLVSSVVNAVSSPNFMADEKRTRERESSLVAGVKPVPREWEVKRNEIIIGRGQRVTARNIAQLSYIRQLFRPGTTPKFFSGSVILFVILGLLSFIYLTSAGKKGFLKETKDIAIVLLNMFMIVILTDLIVRSPQTSYLIPLAGMAMTVTLLVGFRLGFLSVLIMGFMISLVVGGKVDIMLVLLFSSLVGMYAVKDCRRRANILWAGALVGFASFTAIVSVGLINNLDADIFIRDGMWGIASGILSAFITMGLLPVFEYVFKVPTNISLLELSDLNHPLLKRLSIEAPGTYHHSILVGNLAEGACEAIGANSLLARVGAYYHDIGKIPKAEYFSENEMSSGSRHNNLSPSMSALIISKHVKDGVEIARKHKLNRKIIDFITQHHGNSLISFFYQKAMEKDRDGASLKEENFRYPGPRPQTKESAIILLADSVEASSRALEEPTPSSIRNLVKKVTNNKFIDGQLDDCDLTLKDMNKIADSFVRILTGIYHTRLTYPDTDGPKRPVNGKQQNGDKPKKPKQKKKD